MKLLNIFKSFKNDESGAVTVDWVVLTAAVVGLAAAGMAAIKSGTSAMSTKIGSALSTATVPAPTTN